MTIRELQEPDRAAWNEFVAANEHADVLQSWEWGQVKAAGGDWSALRIALFDGAKMVAACSILRRSVPVVGSFYYAPRGPLLADWANTGILRELLEGIRTCARRDGAAFLKIDPAISLSDTAIRDLLCEQGFATPADSDAQGFGGTQPKSNMILSIDGRTDDELMAQFNSMCRRNVRKAQKYGVEVLLDTHKDDIAEFYAVHRVTAQRDGFRIRAISYYQTLWDKLVDRGLAKLVLTRYEGACLSGAICFTIGDKCWYVYGASSNEHRNVMPNYAMQWAMIRWARDRGCRIYDFRGVAPRRPGEHGDSSDEEDSHLHGLDRFKEGFGAQYVEYLGDLDLVFNKRAYWLWTQAKPKVQRLIRLVRSHDRMIAVRRPRPAGD